MPTFTRRVKRFPNVELSVETYSLTSGSSLTLDALQTLVAPPNCTDGFLFWNVKNQVQLNSHVALNDVGSQNFSATAWYLHSCPGGGGGAPNVSTAAFDVATDAFLNDTPIANVTPAAAWVAGSTTVATAGGDVSINARDAIIGVPFLSWSIFGAGIATGDILDVDQNQSSLAFANYAEQPVGPFEPPHIREIVDLFESIRGKIIDWVSDPAPIDLLRISERLREAERTDAGGPQDALSELVTGIGDLTPTQLKSRLADLKSQMSRLEGATKMVADAIKTRGR